MGDGVEEEWERTGSNDDMALEGNGLVMEGHLAGSSGRLRGTP